MKNNAIFLDNDESTLLDEIENDEWIDKPLSKDEREIYKNHAKYTKSLQEKRQTTIRFSVSDLAVIKAKSKDFEIIEQKFRTDKNGKVGGHGLIVLPKDN